MDLVDEVLNKIEEDVSQDKQPLELRVENKTKQIDSLDERYLNGEISSDNYNRLFTKARSDLAEANEPLAKTER